MVSGPICFSKSKIFCPLLLQFQIRIFFAVRPSRPKQTFGAWSYVSEINGKDCSVPI